MAKKLSVKKEEAQQRSKNQGRDESSNISKEQEEVVKKILQINMADSGESDPISKFELWKTFSDKGEQLKVRMWSTGTWMITAMGAILAILIKNGTIAFQTKWPPVAVTNSTTLLFLSGIGILFSRYSLLIIHEFWSSIKHNRMRADYLKGGCIEPPEVAHRSSSEKRLFTIINGLYKIFVIIFVLGIVSAAVDPILTILKPLALNILKPTS
jgi:hypothetical protein